MIGFSPLGPHGDIRDYVGMYLELECWDGPYEGRRERYDVAFALKGLLLIVKDGHPKEWYLPMWIQRNGFPPRIVLKWQPQHNCRCT